MDIKAASESTVFFKTEIKLECSDEETNFKAKDVKPELVLSLAEVTEEKVKPVPEGCWIDEPDMIDVQTLGVLDNNDKINEKTDQNKVKKKKRKSCNTETIYRCANCSYQTVYKWNLVKHIRRHRKALQGNTIHKCTECSYQSTSHRSLLRHIQRHTEIFYCPKCPYSTPCKEKALSHKHNKEDILVETHGCPLCSYSTFQLANLTTHISYHSREDKQLMICSECPYQTAHKFNLQRHVRSKHQSEETRILC